jgi:hypothetical protein
MTAAQLTQWADRKAGGEWQLTAESVAAALNPGRKINELLVMLKNRLSHHLPPLLEFALRSWAGENFTVELEYEKMCAGNLRTSLFSQSLLRLDLLAVYYDASSRGERQHQMALPFKGIPPEEDG